MTEHDIYTVGGTVQAGSGLYIPRKADDELLALCRERRFAYVLTPRQLGKSSLMVRTVKRLQDEGVSSAIIDLTEIGVQVKAEEWYLGLLVKLEEELSLDTNIVDWWHAHAHEGLTQRLTRFFKEVLLVQVEGPVVVFVDEIDTTLSLHFTDDFYAAIRYFYNARSHTPEFKRLSFVLIGVATPGDLIRDPQRTPFNIGQRVELTDFTFEEASPLATGLALAEEEAREVLRCVMKWTGGHPYLTQRLCSALADEHRSTWSESDIDQMVANTFLGEKSKQDSNLEFVRDMLTERVPAAVEVSELMSTYRKVRNGQILYDDEQSLIKSHLKLSGVLLTRNSILVVRNNIYAKVFDKEWIKKHLPGAYLRKRLRRVAAIAAVLALAAVSFAVAGGVAVKSSNEATAQRRIADQQRLIAENQSQIAQRARAEAEQERDNARSQKEIAEDRLLAANVAEHQTLMALAAARQATQRANEQARLAQRNLEKLNLSLDRANLNVLGAAAFQREDYENAQEEFERALQKINEEEEQLSSKELINQLRFSRIGLLLNVGAIHIKLGRPEKALEAYREAQEHWLDLLDWARSRGIGTTDYHPWTEFDIFRGLAQAHSDRAREGSRLLNTRGDSPQNRAMVESEYTEAEEKYKQALAIEERVLHGSQPARIASGLTDLARTYANHKKFSVAESTYNRILRIRRQDAKKEPDLLVESLKEVSKFYYGQLKFEEAQTYLLEAIVVQEGPFDVSTEWRQLDESFADLARLADSEAAKTSLRLERFWLSWSDLSAMNEDVRFPRMKAQAAREIARILHDISIRQRILDYETWVKLGDAYQVLGKAFGRTGRKDLALTRFRKAEIAFHRASEPEPVLVNDSINASFHLRLARLYHESLEDYVKAQQEYERVIEKLEKPTSQTTGNENEDTEQREMLALAFSGLGRLYVGPLHRAADAEKLLLRSLQVAGRRMNLQQLDETYNALAELYRNEKRSQELENIYKRRIANSLTMVNWATDPLLADFKFTSLQFANNYQSIDDLYASYLFYNSELIDFYLTTHPPHVAESVYLQMLGEAPSEVPSLAAKGTPTIDIKRISNTKVLRFYQNMLEKYRKMLSDQGRSSDAARIDQRIKDIQNRFKELENAKRWFLAANS